jgi:uncharacterized damage-inducible protein DinB
MTLPFPEPTDTATSRTEVFLRYLDYFRSVLVSKVQDLSDSDLRGTRLPSGWAPIELLKHLTYVELRWLEWGFEGRDIAEPWGDSRDHRWYVAPEETLTDVITALHDQAVRSRAVIEAHSLSEAGVPGDRWEGADPPSLERILFHLIQEYARHTGHMDIVRELIDGRVDE